MLGLHTPNHNSFDAFFTISGITDDEIKTFDSQIAACDCHNSLPDTIIAMAQPSADGKGKNARTNSERGAQRGVQRGATGNPDEMAAKMITDHDKNRDAELKVDELTAAVAEQRKQRGDQQSGRPNQQRTAQQRAGGPRQQDAGKGKHDAQKGGKQRQRGASDSQQGAGQGSKRGKAQGGQRGPAGRGTDPVQIATKLIAEFDKNGSEGLDVQELVASIKAQRQNRSGKGRAEAEGPGGKGGRGQEGSRRSRTGDSAEAGQEKSPDQGRQGKGKAKAEKDNIEPGTGVVPKRPSE